MNRTLWSMAIVTVLTLCSAGSASAQKGGVTAGECEAFRQKLAAHAKLSSGVRRHVAALPREAPPAAAAPAPSPVASGRGEAIRARLEAIATQRQQLEEQRLGSLVKFEFAKASQIQNQIAQLDREKADLEREQASLPATPAAPVPTPAPTPAPAVTAAVPDRIRCDQFPAAYETAIRIRQRELGAREGQSGAVPLRALTGQTSEQIGQELAEQLGSGADAAGKVGLLDQDGDGRLDGFLDAPAPDVYRVVRQRSDGSLAIEVFVGRGGGGQYGNLARRLDEALARQARWTLTDMLAMQPASPVRVIVETGEFARASSQLLAGNFADAGRIDGPAARSREFENFRGDKVRSLEIVTPTSDGVTVRRVLVIAGPGNQEQWEELTVAIRPVSYWRSDVEAKGTRELRTPGAAATGRTTIGPARFSLER